MINLGGLGGTPADWLDPTGSSNTVNPKYINQALRPDGSLVSFGAVLSDPNFIGNKSDLQAKIAQNAWAANVNPLEFDGPGHYSLSYAWAGNAPKTGGISIVGGTTGTVTPTGFVPATEGAPPPIPTIAPPVQNVPPLPGGAPTAGPGGGGFVPAPGSAGGPAPGGGIFEDPGSDPQMIPAPVSQSGGPLQPFDQATPPVGVASSPSGAGKLLGVVALGVLGYLALKGRK